jgi:MFS superfamily sulfate permease-like transporter
LPGLLIVRPENGLFFANAEAIREVILSEMQSNPQPVKAVLLDLGATTDLDVPSADMLGKLHEELAGREVRLMLARMIMPVRQMLELAGVMAKIRPEDVFVGPAEAVLDYLSSQYDAAGIHELLRSSALSVRQLVQAHLPAVPVERQVALTTLVDNLDQAIQRNEM